MEKEIEIHTSKKPSWDRERFSRRILTGKFSLQDDDYLEIWVNDKLVYQEAPDE